MQYIPSNEVHVNKHTKSLLMEIDFEMRPTFPIKKISSHCPGAVTSPSVGMALQ